MELAHRSEGMSLVKAFALQEPLQRLHFQAMVVPTYLERFTCGSHFTHTLSTHVLNQLTFRFLKCNSIYITIRIFKYPVNKCSWDMQTYTVQQQYLLQTSACLFYSVIFKHHQDTNCHMLEWHGCRFPACQRLSASDSKQHRQEIAQCVHQ